MEANLVDFKEGAASADFEGSSSQYMSITDANLDAVFPLKSGDSNKKISVCGRFQRESTSTWQGLFSKFDTNGLRSFSIGIEANNGNFVVMIGHTNGTATEFLYRAGALVIGRFYHYGVTFQDSDKSWKVVVWDDTAQSKIINASGTATNNISVGTALVGIGARIFNSGTPVQFMDGEIDEVPVFKDILTTGEIDQIRAGIYSVGGVSLEDVRLNLSAFHQDLSDLSTWLRAHDGLEFEDLPALLAAFLQDTDDLPAHLSAGYQDLEGIMLNLQTWAWSIDDVRTALETQGLSLSDLPAAFVAGGWGLGDIMTFLTATDAIVRKDLTALLWATDGIITDDFSVYLSAIGLVPAFRSITAQRLTSVVTEVA